MYEIFLDTTLEFELEDKSIAYLKYSDIKQPPKGYDGFNKSSVRYGSNYDFCTRDAELRPTP